VAAAFSDNSGKIDGRVPHVLLKIHNFCPMRPKKDRLIDKTATFNLRDGFTGPPPVSAAARFIIFLR